MKKGIIVLIAIAALGLTAFSIINKSDSSIKQEIAVNANTVAKMEVDSVKNVGVPNRDVIVDSYFFYGVGTRFNPIKKEELDKATSFSDIISEENAEAIVTFKSLSVTLLEDSEYTNKRFVSASGDFTTAQREFFQSLDYSSNILIEADYVKKDYQDGQLHPNFWTTPYLTIVPEQQAQYKYGKDALINYVKENSKDERYNVQQNDLKPGKLYFKVAKDGRVLEATLATSSGYPEIDKKMIELIINTTGKWEPALNAKGEKVDQTIVFSFGNMGC